MPCKHSNCWLHKTHPCEYCGRIEGIGDAYVRTEYEIENYARRENCRHGRENNIQK